MRKRIFSLVLIFALVLTMASCDQKKDKIYDVNPSVVFITNGTELGDVSDNDEIWNSLELVADDYNMDIILFESLNQKTKEDAIKTAVSEDPNLVIINGINNNKLIKQISSQYPDIQFCLIGSDLEGENIVSVDFENNESAFLAGIDAAMTTKTGSVGYVYNKTNEHDMKAYYGFVAGVETINSSVNIEKIKINKTMTNDDTTILNNKIKDLELDVVYHQAGEYGKTIIKNAKKHNYVVIGSGKDQTNISTNEVISSTTQDSSELIEKLAKSEDNGSILSEHIIYDLNSEKINLIENKKYKTDEKSDMIKEYASQIKKKDIVVPSTSDELEIYKTTINEKEEEN